MLRSETMENFKRLRAGIDTAPFLEEIVSVDNAWSMATGRQDRIKVQREAMAIPLRGLRKSMIDGRKRRDVHESRWTSGSERYPRACAFLRAFGEETDGVLGRAKIVLLPAGRRVYPHIDRGEYYRVRNRHHFVIASNDGSWMRAGDEEVRMREGELWWFDNNKMHEAKNDGEQDRIHMIFDVLPSARAAEATEAREGLAPASV